MNNIHLIKGDITKAKVDAIVNAANPKLLGGGGVDGAIHRAAGSELLKACFAIEPVNGNRCGYGDAKITCAGNLYSRFVIHAVGPIYAKFAEPEKVLASAYSQALDLAIKNQCRTVALPAISCGIYGYPAEEAASVALTVCSQHKYQQLELYFYLFDEEMLRVWRNCIATLL